MYRITRLAVLAIAVLTATLSEGANFKKSHSAGGQVNYNDDVYWFDGHGSHQNKGSQSRTDSAVSTTVGRDQNTTTSSVTTPNPTDGGVEYDAYTGCPINKEDGTEDNVKSNKINFTRKNYLNPCQKTVCPSGTTCVCKLTQCQRSVCPVKATCRALRPLPDFCGTPERKYDANCPDKNMWYYHNRTGKCQKFVYNACGYHPKVYATEYRCQASCIKKPACELIKDVGPCKSYYKRWYYDVTAGKCRLFIYGGCAGNANRFDTFRECMNICSANN